MKTTMKKGSVSRIMLTVSCLAMLFFTSCSDEELEFTPEEQLALEEFEDGILGPSAEIIDRLDESSDYNESNSIHNTSSNEVQLPEMIMETDEEGNKTYYVPDANHEKMVKVPEEQIRTNGPPITNGGYWAFTLYNNSNCYGNKSLSYKVSNSSVGNVITYNLPNNVKNNVRSFALKGNCLLTGYDRTGARNKIVSLNKRGGNSGYVLNSSNRSWESIRLTCWDNKDVNVVAYEHSNYGGAPLPIWDNFTNAGTAAKWGWDTRISSLDLNTHDYTEGIQLGTSLTNDDDYTRMMAFTDNSNLPDDVNDKIIRIVLGRRYAKRCNPRRTCWTGPGCTGQMVSDFEPNFPTTPRSCRIYLQNAFGEKHNGSFCSRNGFCFNPRTAAGYQ